MALNIIITDAGRAELINANHTGTAPVAITHVAFSAQPFTPTKGLRVLPHESRRLSSIAGETVAPDTISVTVKDESSLAYTVHGFGLITEHGTLLAVYSQAAPIIEKSGPTTLLLTTDIVLADIDAAQLSFGDISFSNPPASLTTPGVVTLSNSTESNAQNQAATPRAVKAANDNANGRLAKNQNLADLANPATARVNLGLGSSATLGNTALRTSASTTLLLQAAAMNDHRTSGDHDARYPQRSNNLSDLPSPSQARSNLGLGASATMGTTASRTSTSTTTVLQAKAMNDHRQSDDHDGRYPLKDQVFPSTASITDWNETPNHDCFLFASSGSAENKPPGGATYGWQVSNSSGAYKHQFATGLSSGSFYWRRKNNGAWDPDWSEFFHSSNLSPVETSRTLTAGDGLSGGGNLSGNRTFSVDSTVVRTSRTINTGNGLTGGGNLSANRTLALDNATQQSLAAADSAVQPARTLSAGNGLIGGGNLSANRTISMGTPGSLSGSTSNQASGSTHTHALNIASDALAQQGNNDSALMTPAKTHAAFNQYGLGVRAPYLEDANTTPLGNQFFGAAGASAQNFPSPSWFWPMLQMDRLGGRRWQLTGTNSQLFFRGEPNANDWREWLEVIHSGNINTFFNGSLGGSGWQPLPGGMIFQWGVSGHVNGDANANLSFPIRFPNGCWGVFPTIRNGVTGDDEVFARPITFNATSCTIRAEVAAPTSAVSGSGRFIHYFAIGN